VLPVAEAGVHGDPLDPRLQVGGALLGIGDVREGLLGESLEVRQVAGLDEALHQGGAQLVELEQDDRPIQHRRLSSTARTTLPEPVRTAAS
jgi:hypothetical protein